MIIDNSEENKRLAGQAHEAARLAYAPYSGFKVGAAALTQDNIVYTGCNVENASYGASNCAERTAVFKAVSEGHARIAKIAVVSEHGAFTPPCGICRQILSEFMDSGAQVILESEEGLCAYTIDELLPHHFELNGHV